jgi:HEAT repeat protein
MGSPEAIDMLGLAARTDEANQVRIAAADALGSIGGSRVVSILSPLVDADDPDLSRAALHALGAVGHPDALHPIFAALRSADALKRLDAVLAVAARRDSDAVEALQSVAAEDNDPRVSETAIAELAAMATPASIESLIRLTGDRPSRDRVITALSRLDPAHIEYVAAGLNDPHTDVRRAVVEVLSRMKHPRASELLSKALGDREAQVRLAAVTALKRLGNHTSERELVRLLRSDPDKYVRQAAERALENSGT